MQPPAHRPPAPWQIERARICHAERDLFFQNLELILAHEADILRCDEYFFCRPAFAQIRRTELPLITPVFVAKLIDELLASNTGTSRQNQRRTGNRIAENRRSNDQLGRKTVGNIARWVTNDLRERSA